MFSGGIERHFEWNGLMIDEHLFKCLWSRKPHDMHENALIIENFILLFPL